MAPKKKKSNPTPADEPSSSSSSSSDAAAASSSSASNPTLTPAEDELDEFAFVKNLMEVTTADCILPGMPPLPDATALLTVLPTALPCEQKGSSDEAMADSNQPDTAVEIKIACWNIANLGGGFGYPKSRAKEQITRTAEIIKDSSADIIVVLEVLDRGRPFPKRLSFNITEKTESRSSNDINELIDGGEFLPNLVRCAMKYYVVVESDFANHEILEDFIADASVEIEQKIVGVFKEIGLACFAKTGKLTLSKGEREWLSGQITEQILASSSSSSSSSSSDVSCCSAPLEYECICKIRTSTQKKIFDNKETLSNFDIKVLRDECNELIANKLNELKKKDVSKNTYLVLKI